MKKLFRLTCLAALAWTFAGCGRNGDAVVPENTIVAAYVDFEKAYDDGKDLAEEIIDALPSAERDTAKEAFKTAIKEIDKVREPLKPKWGVIAFGGNPKDLPKAPKQCVTFAVRIDADEDAVEKVYRKLAAHGEVTVEKKSGCKVYIDGDERVCLVDGKYLIGAYSEEAFDDMYDLYTGKGKASEEFGDLSGISGDTVCRIMTAPVSSLLKRFELAKHVEKFGEASQDKELADMILNMGSVSFDIAFADGGEVVMRIACDSSDHAEMVDSFFQLFAFASRLSKDALPYIAKLDNGKVADRLGNFMQSDLFKKLVRSCEVERSGKTVECKSGLINNLLILPAVAIPNFVKYRHDAQAMTCVYNMSQLRTAAESWCVRQYDSSKTPTLRDLCGPEDTKYLKKEPTCPKDGSRYKIKRDEGSGAIEVTCGSGDPDHVLPRP